MSANLCICCGAIIPEGRQVCPICEHKAENRVAPCVACRYSERIRRNNLKVFCQLRGVEVPILHSCEYGDRKMKNYYETKKARYEYILAALDAKIEVDLKAITTGTLETAKRLIDNLSETRELIVSEIEYLEKAIAEENAKKEEQA